MPQSSDGEQHNQCTYYFEYSFNCAWLILIYLQFSYFINISVGLPQIVRKIS